MRSLPFVLLWVTAAVAGQPAPPAFEVASVKIAVDPGPYHWDVTPGRLHLRGMNLKQCILTAYHVEDFQVVGGPAWSDTDRFDIDAKADYPAQRDELLLMLRTLLAERFQLSLQTKPRSTVGYVMVVGKGGLTIKPDPPDTPPSIQVRSGHFTVAGFPSGGLAAAISNILGVAVSDSTSLPGTYSFKLDWTPDEARAQGPVTTLPDALLLTTGLRLDPGKVSIPIYVITRAEKPADD